MLPALLPWVPLLLAATPPDSTDRPDADDATAPRWIVTRTDPARGEVAQARLVVPRLSPAAAESVTVSVFPVSGGDAWLSPSPRYCDPGPGPDPSGPRTWLRTAPTDTVLLACFRSEATATLQLGAAVRRAPAGGPARTDYPASGDIAVGTPGPLSPTASIVLTALVSSVLALLGFAVQERWRQGIEREQRREALQEKLYEAVNRELLAGQATIGEYVRAVRKAASDGAAPPDPPRLDAAGWSQVMLDPELKAYLAKHRGGGYVQGVEALYAEINAYNDAEDRLTKASDANRADRRASLDRKAESLHRSFTHLT
ncbi:MAG TPA: hypothetical protein VF615_19265 [Longimicrobiaceae bacterium]|jgi:hypothetical protein